MAPTPRVTFRGFTFAAGTPAAIKWAEAQAGFTFRIIQGGYNVGKVGASAGTHDKDAVDFSARGCTREDILAMVNALRDAGFAAWHRTVAQGFDAPHVHAVRFGADVSPSAAAQLVAFDLGRDGLVQAKPDSNKYRPEAPVRWGVIVRKPVKRKTK